MRSVVLPILVFMMFWQHIAAQVPDPEELEEDVRVNQQLWLDYNFNNRFNEDQFLSTQVGFRTIDPRLYDRFLAISTLNLRARSGFKLFKEEEFFFSSYHLGAGTIYTRDFLSNDNFELRLIQGIKFKIPTVKQFYIYNYTRLEERFQNYFKGGGWTTGFRLRHRITVAVSWKKHLLQFTEGFYFPISAELFFNLKRADRNNDLIRISPGIGYKFNGGLRLELYAIYNRTKNNTGANNNTNDFILRLRIYQSDKKDAAPLAPVNEFKQEVEQ